MYIVFGIFHSFRNTLGSLECIPTDKEGYCNFNKKSHWLELRLTGESKNFHGWNFRMKWEKSFSKILVINIKFWFSYCFIKHNFIKRLIPTIRIIIIIFSIMRGKTSISRIISIFQLWRFKILLITNIRYFNRLSQIPV